jgi:hypothetical protein
MPSASKITRPLLRLGKRTVKSDAKFQASFGSWKYLGEIWRHNLRCWIRIQRTYAQWPSGVYGIYPGEEILGAGEAGNAAGMEDADVNEDEGENDHGYGGDPGDDVERA